MKEHQTATGAMLSQPERMLKWFEHSHLPAHLAMVSKPFGDLANKLCELVPPNPERTVALRKLLEAKDAGVRAYLEAQASRVEQLAGQAADAKPKDEPITDTPTTTTAAMAKQSDIVA